MSNHLLYTSAEEAEEAFYEAIGRGDIEALMQVWSDDDEIVCIHPTGERLTGAAAIRESWRAIFANNPGLMVRILRSVRWKGVIMAVHSVLETVHLAEDPSAYSPMQSTNVYLRGPRGWRLLSHHTSAAPEPVAGTEAAGAQTARPHTLH